MEHGNVNVGIWNGTWECDLVLMFVLVETRGSSGIRRGSEIVRSVEVL